MSIGDALAQARSQAGLTIAQVSQRTCIRETIIRDIERGDFSACGGDFYARGHIRSIARAVGLDPGELIHDYDVTHGTPQEITAAEVFEPATPIKLKERRAPNWSVAMAVVLAVVVGYGIYQAVGSSSNSAPPSRQVAAGGSSPAAHPATRAPSTHAPTTRPTPSASPTQPAAHVKRSLVIQLTAIQDCWVEFTKPSGVYLQQVTVLAGTTKTWTFRHSVDMHIGNPGGIKLVVNGKSQNSLGINPTVLSFGPSRKLASQAASSG